MPKKSYAKLNLTLIHNLKKKIEELKKAQQKLKEISELNQEIIEKLPMGIYILNKKGVIDYINPAMAEISGISRKKFLKVEPFNLPTYKKIGLVKKIKDIFKGKSFSLGPVEYISHYAKKRTIRKFIGIPVREDDAIVKALIVVEDFTKIEEGYKRRMIKCK